MPTLINPYAFPPGTALSAVQRLGLTNGLKLCLDAGDINSYSGSGQVWSDTSGNAYHFNRGTGSGSDSADPTFNGTAGRQSSAEYWSFDGGDYFTLGQSNPTWVNNLHKNDALFSIAGWIWIASTGSQQGILATSIVTDQVGAGFYVSSTGLLRWSVVRGTAEAEAFLIGGLSVATAGWHFVGISLNEAAGSNGAIMQVDGTQESLTSTYSSPSSSNASNTIKVGRADSTLSENNFRSGGRIPNIEAWEGVALSAQNLTDLYNATKGKFL
jgi:hypothetical protein